MQSKRNTLSRQWEMLKLIPAGPPGLTSGAICEMLDSAGYSVSKRTVERDLDDLSLVFPLQCNDKGTPYGWYWASDKGADLPSLSLSESMTLSLVEDSIRPLLPRTMFDALAPRFGQAKRKLEALANDNPTARWIDKVANVQPTMNLLAPEVDPDCLDALQAALLHDRKISCRYLSANKNRTQDLVLNPLALVQRGQIAYLVACADPFEDVRLYAVHRFESVVAQQDLAHGPEGFKLSEYIRGGALQFGTPQTIFLSAWVNAALAQRLLETPLSDDMNLVLEEDGAYVNATVTDTWALKWWLLSQAGSIRVDEPASLRQAVIDCLKQSLALHDAEGAA